MTDGTLRKPDVPKKTDNPVMGIHTNKDFVKTNVLENTTAVARKPQPIYADTKRGDKQLLEKSGLVPKYIKKKVWLYLGLFLMCSKHVALVNFTL